MNLKSIAQKRPSKDEREKMVLLKLVELYLESGCPIGSETLKNQWFKDLSSATIRNYFGKLEDEGFLMQQHTSGGRIPTEKAYKLYVEDSLAERLSEKCDEELKNALAEETKEVAGYLQRAAKILSDATSCAVFLSAPRFDRDFILNIRLVKIDTERFLAALVTDFGLIHTEILHADEELNDANLKKLESYFLWRLSGHEKPHLTRHEEKEALNFYNELMLRHIVRYANFDTEDSYKTGFSKLLGYNEFSDPSVLANALSLFENRHGLSELLRMTIQNGELSYWIGSDLCALTPLIGGCSVIAIPYKINQVIVGAIAILGPTRLPYRKLFKTLTSAAFEISQTLTKSLYKFKISYREPKEDPSNILDQTQGLFIENKKP
jgi:heat-inducible transcriptional repressor